MSHPLTPARRAGFSLIEVMISLVILGILSAGVLSMLRSQNRAFTQGVRKTDALENQRYALATVERVVRTLGAGVAGRQPMMVYGGPDVVAFNADFVENDTASTDTTGIALPMRWAVYFNPALSDAQSRAWEAGAATPIPNSAYTYPTITYRQADSSTSPAETIILYLQADGTTTRGDDFALWQRVNAEPAEVVARNILPHPTRPFFEYFMRRVPDTLFVAPTGWMPLIRRDLTGATTAADSANFTRPDSVKAVRINMRITNGQTGVNERTQDVSTMVELPNNGLPLPSVCGRRPLPVTALTATPDSAGTGRVTLEWPAAPDHFGGELDVRQYVVYQRDDTVTVWRDPLLTVRADTTTSYELVLGGLSAGAAYDFAVAAQDCTPQNSTLISRTVTLP